MDGTKNAPLLAVLVCDARDLRCFGFVRESTKSFREVALRPTVRPNSLRKHPGLGDPTVILEPGLHFDYLTHLPLCGGNTHSNLRRHAWLILPVDKARSGALCSAFSRLENMTGLLNGDFHAPDSVLLIVRAVDA